MKKLGLPLDYSKGLLEGLPGAWDSLFPPMLGRASILNSLKISLNHVAGSLSPALTFNGCFPCHAPI